MLCVPRFHPPVVYVYQISQLCDKFQVFYACGGPYLESLDVAKSKSFFLIVRSGPTLVRTKVCVPVLILEILSLLAQTICMLLKIVLICPHPIKSAP